MAPDAELLIYKVFADVSFVRKFRCGSQLTNVQDPLDTDEEVLMQAFCDAYGAGVCLHFTQP